MEGLSSYLLNIVNKIFYFLDILMFYAHFMYTYLHIYI